MRTGRKWLYIAVFVPSLAAAGDLPNPELTPGVVRDDITVAKICATKWGKDKRHVTKAMRKVVLAAYGTLSCMSFELDHLISRELGGADHIDNLWPQCYTGTWNAHMKDRLENRLHKEVCAGSILIEDVQEEIRSDWRIPYRRYFGEPKVMSGFSPEK